MPTIFPRFTHGPDAVVAPLSAEGRVLTLFELVRRHEDAAARLAAQRGVWSELRERLRYDSSQHLAGSTGARRIA